MMTRAQIVEAADRLRRLTPEEIEAYDLTPIPPEEEVRARVADYQERIERLFADIERWISEDGRYTARRTGTSFIFEPLMALYEVPDQPVPVLSVFAADGTEVLRFRPNGLWVVPTNGRVAIETPNVPRDRRVPDLRLLDKARPPAGGSWNVWGHRDWRQGGEPFDASLALRLADEQHALAR